MRGITSVSILPTLLYTVEDLCVNMCTSVCIQIVHVQTCSSLNEVKPHVVRGSIGLADTEGAGTPLTQGQDIPLTGARKGGLEMSETERKRDTEEALQFLSVPTSSLPSLGGFEITEQRRRRKVRETKGAKLREWK